MEKVSSCQGATIARALSHRISRAFFASRWIRFLGTLILKPFSSSYFIHQRVWEPRASHVIVSKLGHATWISVNTIRRVGGSLHSVSVKKFIRRWSLCCRQSSLLHSSRGSFCRKNPFLMQLRHKFWRVLPIQILNEIYSVDLITYFMFFSILRNVVCWERFFGPRSRGDVELWRQQRPEPIGLQLPNNTYSSVARDRRGSSFSDLGNWHIVLHVGVTTEVVRPSSVVVLWKLSITSANAWRVMVCGGYKW